MPRIKVLKGRTVTLTGRVLLSVVHRPSSKLQTVTKDVESLIGADWICHEFTKSRTSDQVFQLRPGDHEEYIGGPITLINYTLLSNEEEPREDIIKMLGLKKHIPLKLTRTSHSEYKVGNG